MDFSDRLGFLGHRIWVIFGPIFFNIAIVTPSLQLLLLFGDFRIILWWSLLLILFNFFRKSLFSLKIMVHQDHAFREFYT